MVRLQGQQAEVTLLGFDVTIGSQQVVCAREQQQRIVGPAFEPRVVSGQGQCAADPAFAGCQGSSPAIRGRRRRQFTRADNHHPPAIRQVPTAQKERGALQLALGLAGIQHEAVPARQVSGDHRVMPFGKPLEQQVLQHQHRAPRLQLGEQGVALRRQHVGQTSVAARGGQQFHLEAALSLRNEHGVGDIGRLNRNAAVGQHGGERSRSALVLRLGKERNAAQFQRLRSQRGLRDAPPQQQRRGQDGRAHQVTPC